MLEWGMVLREASMCVGVGHGAREETAWCCGEALKEDQFGECVV